MGCGVAVEPLLRYHPLSHCCGNLDWDVAVETFRAITVETGSTIAMKAQVGLLLWKLKLGCGIYCWVIAVELFCLAAVEPQVSDRRSEF